MKLTMIELEANAEEIRTNKTLGDILRGTLGVLTPMAAHEVDEEEDGEWAEE